MGNLVDPIAEKEEPENVIKNFNDLTFNDLQAIPARAAKMAHPFDGYPYEKIKIGVDEKGKDIMYVSTFIVLLFPSFIPPQDISGENVTILKEIKNKKGDIIGKEERIVTLKTSHNRVIVDHDAGRINTSVVFDREFELAEGKKILGALVPSHSVRAQLLYRYDAVKQRTFVDERYVLIDIKQQNRLKKVFDIVMFDKLRGEKLAQRHYAETEGV